MSAESIRPNRSASAEIVRGLVFAGLMVAAAAGSQLLSSMGVLTDSTWPKRLTMALLGVMVMRIGNDLPKSMWRLATLTCDPARLQRFQRLAGWTWVMTGGMWAVAWLALPVSIAQTITLAVVATAAAVIGVSLLALRRDRRARALPGTSEDR